MTCRHFQGSWADSANSDRPFRIRMQVDEAGIETKTLRCGSRSIGLLCAGEQTAQTCAIAQLRNCLLSTTIGFCVANADIWL